MIRSLIAALLCAAAPFAVQAACAGEDRFAAMDDAARRAVIARAHAAPHASGLLYRAEKEGREITLIGTFHLPDARHDALVETVGPALAAARVLLVEAGPEEEARLTGAVGSDPTLMFNPTGPTLPELLPEEDWQRLAALASARGTPAVLAAKMKPAFLAMTLAIPPCAAAALASGAAGLDKALIARAEAERVPVAALEPWDTVFRLFDALPQEDTLALLRSAMAEADNADSNTATMANLYFDREPRVLWELSADWARATGQPAEDVARDMALSETVLMNRRNHDWMPVIEAAPTPAVVAVGALHLSGAEGLLALLEAAGYRITRLD